MKKYSLLLMAAGTLLLTGCPKKPTTPPAADNASAVPAEATNPAPAQESTAPTTSTGDATTLPPAQPLADPEAELLARTVIYFDFDSDAVREEFASTIAAHGRKLAGGALKLRLEGHTDERGSDSYNNALGLRRAEAVKKALRLAGAPDAQVEAVTFGEQKPAVGGEGEGEEAWSKNRRVEIVYPAQ
jgi:peptidoglycan-associated lipoprotein